MNQARLSEILKLALNGNLCSINEPNTRNK